MLPTYKIRSTTSPEIAQGDLKTFGLGAEAAALVIRSSQTSYSAFYFIGHYWSQDANKITGDLQVRLTRSSSGGGVYLHNQTDRTDRFNITYIYIE